MLDPVDDTTDTEEDLIDMDVGHDTKMSPSAQHASIDTILDHKATPVPEDMVTSPRPLDHIRRTSSITATSDSNLTGKRSDRDRKKYTPLNLASRPRQTRNKTVTIKPGTGTTGDVDGNKAVTFSNPAAQLPGPTAQGGVGELLVISGGKEAKDGVQALQASHGSLVTPPGSPKSPEKTSGSVKVNINKFYGDRPRASRKDSEDSQSTIASLQERDPRHSWTQIQKRSARSGSITENIIETNGVKKVVLEMTSSSSETERGGEEGVALPPPKPDGKGKERDEGGRDLKADSNGVGKFDEEDSADASGDDRQDENSKPDDGSDVKSGKKKRRRKRKKAGAAYAKAMAAAGQSIDEAVTSNDDNKGGAPKGGDNAYGEETPLLGRR